MCGLRYRRRTFLGPKLYLLFSLIPEPSLRRGRVLKSNILLCIMPHCSQELLHLLPHSLPEAMPRGGGAAALLSHFVGGETSDQRSCSS